MPEDEFWTMLADLWVKAAPKLAPVEKIELPEEDGMSLLDFLATLDDEI